MARRTAVTLIGSYVALSTNTGSCISEPRRGTAELWVLLPAGRSLEDTEASAAVRGLCPRGFGDSCRIALIALSLGLTLTGSRKRIVRRSGYRERHHRLGSSVAPVVITSSSNKTRRLPTWLPGRISKAPRTAAHRSRSVNTSCAGLG